MTWLNKKYGMSYHCLLELFRRLKLPLFDGMTEALRRGNEVHASNLENEQTEDAKENRTSWKKARVQEQEERKIGFVDKGFSTLMARMKKMMMIMMN